MTSLDLLGDLLTAAKAAGAESADAIFIAGTSVSVQRRLGRTEHLERSESRDLGLRVFVGRRSAIVSASSIDPASFSKLAERAIDMARVVPEDPFSGLADASPAADAAPLELDDPTEPSEAALVERASVAEAAALAVPGITNSEGAEAGFSRTEIYLADTNGFAGSYARTSHSVSATALAGEGTGMQRDCDFSSCVHMADLEDSASIGHSAGERAVSRLNPTRPKTADMPVIFDPRVAGSLLGHFSAAINGASIARGTSFLKDSLGKQIFPRGIFIHDDPTRKRGLRSRPFDAEGQKTAARALIEDGVLTTWLLDTRSARQLGMTSTGHAVRGTSGPPSPSASNLFLAAGLPTPAELMADISLGLYVTELIGMGVNGVTGDYSRGAAGFMIRDGAIAEPVAEITIAGTLQKMFSQLVAANDLRLRRGTDAPTIRIEMMTIAGA
jgi:PmbA protein